MIPEYSPQEILRVAIKVEEKGELLYKKLEISAKEEKIREIWRYLAEQEHIHKDVFSRMLGSIGDYIVDDFNPGEYDNYLRAMASQYIFTPEVIDEKIKNGFPCDAEAVDFGISIEKESILIYSAMKERVKSEKAHLVDKIINEEKKHLVLLVSLKGEIK